MSSDRPRVSAPDALSPEALADARRAQPKRGLAGLLFVLPVAALLAANVDLAPVVTFALPIVAMIAFWWEDWPGTLARGGWSGMSDTAIVVVGGVLLNALGHGSLPLAAGIFTAMLQLTLVCERWPLSSLSPIPSGVAALVLSWVIGLAAYQLPIPRENYGAWLTSLGAWQMIWYVALRGWPFARLRSRVARLVTGNVVVAACGWATSLVAGPTARLTAVAGAVIAAVLLVSMLFEAWPAIRLDPLPGRGLTLVIIAALAAVLSWTLPMVADRLGVRAGEVDGWVAHVTLNSLSLAVILHVAVWRRWPRITA